ncbi:signal recognition particle subunit Srp14p [Diutina catenulata]
MTRLDNSEFLSQVGSLLADNNGKSSVYLTQKRLVAEVEPSTHPLGDLASNVVKDEPSAPENTTTYPVLVRVTMNGTKRGDKSGKKKLSTVVEAPQMEEFWATYIGVLRDGMVGLKQTQKKKKKENKVTK